MFLAIVLGVLAGAVGFLPLVLGLTITRKKLANKGQAGPMIVLIGSLFVSFIFLFLVSLAFASYDKPSVLPFVLSEAIALCVVAIGFGVWSVRSREKNEGKGR